VTRKSRRKPLELLKTDSEMAPPRISRGGADAQAPLGSFGLRSAEPAYPEICGLGLANGKKVRSQGDGL
jgi:hypothetical protein